MNMTLVFAGITALLFARILSLAPHERVRLGLVLHVVPAIVAAGILTSIWMGGEVTGFRGDVSARAVNDSGVPMSTVVVLETEGKKRDVRRIPLEIKISGLVEGSALLLILSLISLVGEP